MIHLKDGSSAADMPLCCSFCEHGYLSRLAALLLAVCRGSPDPFRRLSQSALPEPWYDFDVLKSLVRWVRGVVLEAQMLSPSRPNMFVGWHNV